MHKKLLLSLICIFLTSTLSANVVEVAGYRFTAPDSWEQTKPSSSMRKAQLKIAGEDGKEAELVFFYFGPSGGGGVRANVDRWLKQFENMLDQSVKEEIVHDVKTTFVRIWGTFLSGSPFGPKTPKSGYSLSGAIIEGKNGAIFLKMVGHSKVVDQNHDALVSLISKALEK